MFQKFDLLWAWFVRVATNWLPDAKCCLRLRGALYSLAMKKAGRNFQVASDVRFTHLQWLSVGDNVYVGPNSVLILDDDVTIGNDVLIAHKVMITSRNHAYENGKWNKGSRRAPIVVEDGAWIGANAAVLPGVTIGRGTVLAACSSAPKSLPDYAVCAGVPAAVKKTLEPPKEDQE